MNIKISNSSFTCGLCSQTTVVDNYTGGKSLYCECGHCLIDVCQKITVPEQGLIIQGGSILEDNS